MIPMPIARKNHRLKFWNRLLAWLFRKFPAPNLVLFHTWSSNIYVCRILENTWKRKTILFGSLLLWHLLPLIVDFFCSILQIHQFGLMSLGSIGWPGDNFINTPKKVPRSVFLKLTLQGIWIPVDSLFCFITGVSCLAAHLQRSDYWVSCFIFFFN